jgi:predicted amidophosphoribosyltransferase
MRSRFTPRSRATRLQRSQTDFFVRARPRAADVIVVDDVAVTGATVRAVCGALVSAGYAPSLVVVAADVPDR